MSSHHIVREKQEPALLILGLNTFDHELLGQLLEWSPAIIAGSHAAEQLNSMGIKVDRVLGNDVGDVLQSDIAYISTHNASPIEAALSFLTHENYGAVNIVTDDFKLGDFIQFVQRINLVIFHQHTKTYAINPGFTKWLPSGEVVTLHSQPAGLVATGLSATSNGRFVTTDDGVVKLEFSGDFIFISETI